MTESTFDTLDAALQEIAERSFYESATVTPNENGTFTVADDFGTSFPDEIVMWTYDGGMELPANVLDHSRAHEAYEFYNDASHIRYNLPAAVERLEEGKAVTFAYVIVDTYPTTPEDIADQEAGLYDATVGWALLAAAV